MLANIIPFLGDNALMTLRNVSIRFLRSEIINICLIVPGMALSALILRITGSELKAEAAWIDFLSMLAETIII